jgi:hypothetical protein
MQSKLSAPALLTLMAACATPQPKMDSFPVQPGTTQVQALQEEEQTQTRVPTMHAKVWELTSWVRGKADEVSNETYKKNFILPKKLAHAHGFRFFMHNFTYFDLNNNEQVDAQDKLIFKYHVTREDKLHHGEFHDQGLDGFLYWSQGDKITQNGNELTESPSAEARKDIQNMYITFITGVSVLREKLQPIQETPPYRRKDDDQVKKFVKRLAYKN